MEYFEEVCTEPADLSGFTTEEIKQMYSLYVMMITYGYIPKMDIVNEYAKNHTITELEDFIINIKKNTNQRKLYDMIIDAINARVQ